MKRLNMSLVFAAITFTVLQFSFPALASEGGNAGGGGNIEESEFKDIARNIEQWIRSGNADQLKLPAGLTKRQFKEKMLKALGKYSVSMLPEHPVIDGVTKTCRGEAKPTPTITCHQKDFGNAFSSNINGTYRLVFHEFAGIAGVERNKGSDSDYSVSDQVSKYLRDEVVRRLPIEPMQPSQAKSTQLLACGDNQLISRMDGEFSNSADLDNIEEQKFFDWLRANKKSPLVVAEAKVMKAQEGDVRFELGDLAPSNGLVLESSISYRISSSVRRYVETMDYFHSGIESTPSLEIEVLDDVRLDESTTNSKFDATVAYATMTLSRIREYTTDSKGNRVLKTVYQGKTDFDPSKCRRVKSTKS